MAKTIETVDSQSTPFCEAGEAAQRVGRYTLLRMLGRGGMGVVHLARDELLGRKVALKLLECGTPGLQARLLVEAQALARLSHPNVVAIYEAGEHDGRVYLAMERIVGDTLRGWFVARPRRLSEVLEVALQAARGLAAAHDAGLVHRDVKPDNIMIGEDGRVRVMDFGLARVARTRADDDDHHGSPPSPAPLTALGAIVGTPGYMAPEQRRGAMVDTSSDIYSFCVVLCELLLGTRPPADRGELQAALTRRRAPRWLVRLVLRGLDHDPVARWPTMHALIAAYEVGLRREWARTVMRVATGLLLLLASWVGAWQAHVVIAQHQRSRFDEEVRKIESAIEQRMTAYVQVLRGGLGLFVVEGVGDLDRWQRYVETLQLDRRYPGFKALSFAAAVTTDELPAFARRVRAGPVPAAMDDPGLIRRYTVRSNVDTFSPLPVHSPIVFIAPLVPANTRVLGIDMMQEPGRRAAMERSAADGTVVLSPRLRLVGQADGRLGFIAYLAVRRDGVLVGWLTAAFLADNFMRGLLGGGAPTLAFEVYDGDRVAPEALLYSTAGLADGGLPLPVTVDAAAPTLDRVGRVELPGRAWTLRYQATPAFVPLTDRLAPWLIVLSGLFAAVLFAVMSRTRARLGSVLE